MNLPMDEHTRSLQNPDLRPDYCLQSVHYPYSTRADNYCVDRNNSINVNAELRRKTTT